VIQESGNVPSHQKTLALERYLEAAAGKSNTEAQNIAANVPGSQLDWDWDRALFSLFIKTRMTAVYYSVRRN